MDRELTAATWQRDTTRHRHMLSGRLRLARPLVRPAARGMCSKDFDEELGLRRSAMSKALRQQPKPQPRPRALVLIDPPYQMGGDTERIVQQHVESAV